MLFIKETRHYKKSEWICTEERHKNPRPSKEEAQPMYQIWMSSEKRCKKDAKIKKNQLGS